jgi:hypothetical protein
MIEHLAPSELWLVHLTAVCFAQLLNCTCHDSHEEQIGLKIPLSLVIDDGLAMQVSQELNTNGKCALTRLVIPLQRF